MAYANGADPDQTAVWSGSVLFAFPLSDLKNNDKKQNLGQKKVLSKVFKILGYLPYLRDKKWAVPFENVSSSICLYEVAMMKCLRTLLKHNEILEALPVLSNPNTETDWKKKKKKKKITETAAFQCSQSFTILKLHVLLFPLVCPVFSPCLWKTAQYD